VAHPAFCSTGTVFLCQGLKCPEREADHLTVSSAEVKNERPVGAVVAQTCTAALSPVTEADLIECC
jgi:hypothetical protein